MKVLVIGANGFLGRHLVKRCLLKNWDTTCVYHTNKDFIPQNLESIHINNLDKLDNSYNLVFLLAAFIPYRDFDKAEKKLVDTNIKIMLKVVEKFKKSRIIFSSSVAIYGNHNSIINEHSSFNNPNLYGLSKLSAEFILILHSNYQIVRFSSIYGTGMYPNTLIPRTIAEAKKNKKIILRGDGSRLQDYLYVEDAINYLILASERRESGIYLGVSGKSYSNKEVAKIIQKFIPGCKIEYNDEDQSASFVYNNSLTRQLLKFMPQFSLESSLEGIIKVENEK